MGKGSFDRYLRYTMFWMKRCGGWRGGGKGGGADFMLVGL